MTDDGILAVLIGKLERLGKLDDADRSVIRELPFRIENVPEDYELVREGRAATDCCVLLKGFACRHKMARDGARQIVSFHVPGDMLDLQDLLLARADHTLETITRATVAWVSGSCLTQVVRKHPALAEAFWRDTLIDASVFREWVLNIGRRDAKTRIAPCYVSSQPAGKRRVSALPNASSYRCRKTRLRMRPV